MKDKSYTLFIASNETGGLRRLRIPYYVVHLLAILVVVGGLTVGAAVGSYSRMLWKVTNYNHLRRDEANLKQQFHQLQSQVTNTNERLNSLQSLASEVAVTYGITRLPQAPFHMQNSTAPDALYQQSVAQFQFLQNNASLLQVSGRMPDTTLLPKLWMTNAANLPSIWPVRGLLTSRFGERLDPFNGEGSFHTGLDIGVPYGTPVEAAADGVVVEAGIRGGYGRVVIIDHGFGITTWYAHLSGFNTHVGMHVRRGDIIGYVGRSGRATAPHLHYEVRLNDTPVNPWRYMQGGRMNSGD